MATGSASDGSSMECSQLNAPSVSAATIAKRVPPRPIRPVGNSMTSSDAISSVPKREDSMVTVDMLEGLLEGRERDGSKGCIG